MVLNPISSQILTFLSTFFSFQECISVEGGEDDASLHEKSTSKWHDYLHGKP